MPIVKSGSDHQRRSQRVCVTLFVLGASRQQTDKALFDIRHQICGQIGVIGQASTDHMRGYGKGVLTANTVNQRLI